MALAKIKEKDKTIVELETTIVELETTIEKLEHKIKKQVDILETTFFLIFIGVFLTIATISTMYIGDTGDRINTQELGKILCGEKGLDYQNRTIKNGVPIIECKEKEVSKIKKKELIDSIVFINEDIINS